MKLTVISNLLLMGIPLIGFSQQPLAIGQSHKIHSHILEEQRTVNVYLPDGYLENDTARYPVIYVIDGGMQEDFLHISGIVQYNTQPWINRFPKSIVVGIENTERRRDCTFAVDDLSFLDSLGFDKETFPNPGGSAAYIAFLENELQPFIDSVYRTVEHRTVIGESLSGLLASEILLKHRKLFDTYIIMSPSLWWDNGKLLRDAPMLLSSANKEQVSVYVGACNRGEDEEMYRYATELHGVLKRFGGPETVTYFDYLPQESHSTLIHQSVYNAFRMLYPNTIDKR